MSPADHQVLLELGALDPADRYQLAAWLRRLTTIREVRPRVAEVLGRAAGHTLQTLDHGIPQPPPRKQSSKPRAPRGARGRGRGRSNPTTEETP